MKYYATPSLCTSKVKYGTLLTDKSISRENSNAPTATTTRLCTPTLLLPSHRISPFHSLVHHCLTLPPLGNCGNKE
ncbi:hypothetical protein E2C01_010305 [Portunus trituberculatus]|uniref:Uncharacterized protein n=1 Tax=Portunus trituberculatus TaxID=210409 RepID=A0A5B7D813_PORTR|nr:hypothetical protein [Portunus trituberculatus]